MNVDPIADFLTRIRNAQQMQHPQVTMPSSSVKVDLARILKQEGFITDLHVRKAGSHTNLELDLKYDRHGAPVISHLRRVSKRGRRVYAGWRDVGWVRSGLGIWILTTPQGIMTGRQARRARVGGEVLCEVW